MLSVYSEEHKLRNAKTELYGGELVPPFECPARVDFILSRIKEIGLGKIIGPDDYGLEPVLRIHDADYVAFLENCWNDWRDEGFKGEALPTVWPARRMRQDRIPKFIEGKLGYYALAAETSISDGTW